MLAVIYAHSLSVVILSPRPWCNCTHAVSLALYVVSLERHDPPTLFGAIRAELWIICKDPSNFSRPMVPSNTEHGSHSVNGTYKVCSSHSYIFYLFLSDRCQVEQLQSHCHGVYRSTVHSDHHFWLLEQQYFVKVVIQHSVFVVESFCHWYN